MKAIKQTLLAIALAGAFTTANAIPVDWTLNNVKFENKSVNDAIFYIISGTFTYDVDTNLFSNVNIVNTQHRDNYNGTFGVNQYGAAATSITGTANQISFLLVALSPFHSHLP